MAEQTSHHKITLSGEMTVAYQGVAYAIDGASLRVLFEDGRQPYDLELRLHFTDGDQVAGLAQAFPALVGQGAPLRFGFSMKPAALAFYREIFAQVDSLEQWVTVAGGACFELEHYEGIGPVEAL